MAIATMSFLVAAYGRFIDANMQDDFVVALRATPNVVAFLNLRGNHF